LKTSSDVLVPVNVSAPADRTSVPLEDIAAQVELIVASVESIQLYICVPGWLGWNVPHPAPGAGSVLVPVTL
jgi:hypothetical protein